MWGTPNDTCGTGSKPSGEHRLGVLSIVTVLGTRLETESEETLKQDMDVFRLSQLQYWSRLR